MQSLLPDNIDVLLKEYEIVIQQCENKGNAQNALFVFALTAIGAILSFSLQQQNPYIAMVSFPVLIAIRCRVMWLRDSIFRDMVYLELFIEPKLLLNKKAKRGVREAHPIVNVQYWIYTILGIGAFATYMAHNTYNGVSFVAIIILLITTIVLDTYYVFWSKKMSIYYKNYFTKQLSETKKR